MLKKLFLIPWIGDFPIWMPQYREHIKHLKKYGYDFYISNDEDDFATRVEKTLGFSPVITRGSSLSHNYRSAFGLMYQDILKDYDFWGITDLDCVYGNISHFNDDIDLEEIDIWSNHHNYICGPWTLFKNTDRINTLFKKVPNWEELMRSTTLHPGRWTEVEFSQAVDKEHNAGEIYREYTHYQGKDPNIWFNLSFKDGMLYDDKEEIMTFHFNRHKIWPLSRSQMK